MTPYIKKRREEEDSFDFSVEVLLGLEAPVSDGLHVDHAPRWIQRHK